MTRYLVYSNVGWVFNYCLWHQQWYLCTPRFFWLFAFIVTLLSSFQRNKLVFKFSGRYGVGYRLPEWIAKTKGAFCVW